MKILQAIKQFWKWKVCKWWYKFFYNVSIGDIDGSMFPALGKGEFVSVLRNGPYFEITSHGSSPDINNGMIRIIPFQPNHGIMIEFVHSDGKIGNRTHLDYNKLASFLGKGKENVGRDSKLH